MPGNYAKGWECGSKMRNWRHRKGGLKRREEKFLQTRLGQNVDEWLKGQTPMALG